MLSILPLGTNGFFPSFGRHTACFALRLPNALLLFDAGTGLFRLGESEGQKLLTGVEEIYLFLSHYHLDHTFGFYGAFQLFQDRRVFVYGRKGKKVFAELPAQEYFPVNYDTAHKQFQWRVLPPGEKASFPWGDITTRAQLHNGLGSLAFRCTIDSVQFAYVTDSEPTDESVAFVAGVDLLLHEHWLVREKEKERSQQLFGGHVSSIGAARVAKEARVGKLALIHHYPFATDEQLRKQEKIAQGIFSETLLAKDLTPIALSSSF